ncbi:hypothetical protein HN51_044989, partial [Arachis hypogaea]
SLYIEEIDHFFQCDVQRSPEVFGTNIKAKLDALRRSFFKSLLLCSFLTLSFKVKSQKGLLGYHIEEKPLEAFFAAFFLIY